MLRTRVALLFALVAILFPATSALAWTGPTGSPPSNNVSAPINVSSTFQDKPGAIWFDGGVGVNSGSAFCIGTACATSWAQAVQLGGGSSQWTTSGSNIYYTTGSVGIDTTNPRAALEVNGSILNTTAYNANTNLGSYNIGVSSIGAGSSIYSYGSICAGNSYGNCLGTGGVVINASGITFPNGTTQTTAAASGIGGSGTAGYVPRFTAGTTLGNSTILDNGSSATAGGNFFVNGYLYDGANTGYYLKPSSYSNLAGMYLTGVANNWAEEVSWPPSSAPSGSYGILVGTSAGGYSEFENNAGYWTELANSTYGLETNGSISASSYCISGSSCISAWPSAGIGGSGSTNYVARFTGASTLGTGTLTDNGSSATAGGNFFVNGYLYDGANTNYYLKPSAVSNLNVINFAQLNAGDGALTVTPSSYGTFGLSNGIGGYYGILMGTNSNEANLMYDGAGNGGIYYQGSGIWEQYFTKSDNHLNIMTAGDLGATLGVNGTGYFSGDVTINGGNYGLTVSDGSINDAGGMTVGQASTFNGALYANNGLYVTGAANTWGEEINWPPSSAPSGSYGILVGTSAGGYSEFENNSGYWTELANSTYGLETNGNVSVSGNVYVGARGMYMSEAARDDGGQFWEVDQTGTGSVFCPSGSLMVGYTVDPVKYGVSSFNAATALCQWIN